MAYNCHGENDHFTWHDIELCGHITPKQAYKEGNYVGKDPTMKASNPKDIVGSTKVPMGLVPPITTAYLGLAHLEGDLKYGRANWREAGIRAMIYVDACLRHIGKWRDGEEADPETHVPHLANALTCLSIIVDAQHSGKMIDDRPISEPTAKAIDDLSGVVKHLSELHKDKKPVDYFITGAKQREG